jgi:hypothetical protein
MSMTLHLGSTLTETQVNENYERFIEFLKESFIGDRLEKLLKLYAEDNYGLRAATAPASGKLHFHYAHTGGYLQHIANVEKATRGTTKLYEMMGGTVDFTEEERIFCALHHDLGKLGNENGEYYVPNTDQWSITKRLETFKHNPKTQFWRVTDNALYVLQQHQIILTWKETLGIKLADGPYDDENLFYLKGFNPDQALRTNLPYVIHMGDFLSSRVEYDQWKKTL